jgi:photosystem II stability/assembly factor-like uncharacterized protein
MIKQRLLPAMFFLAALLTLIACPTTDEPERVLSMQIDKDNDSLLTFDSIVVVVYSNDSSFSQVVFHDKLRDPKQVSSLHLDSRIGKQYKVSIVGYKGGKVGVRKEVTILAPGDFESKDVPTSSARSPDTITVISIPEILAPTDTFVTEGDSLRFRVSIRNPLTGATTLTLKDVLSGAALDTAGRDPGDGYFTWKPNFNQGRVEPYAVTIVYASSERKAEKIISIKVVNSNRLPHIKPIENQSVKEGEALAITLEGSDPDQDSLTYRATNLPLGSALHNGAFTWKPTSGQAGNYSVRFSVSDGHDSDLAVVLITVGNVEIPAAPKVKITSPGRDTSVNYSPITIYYTVNGIPLQKVVALSEGKRKVFIDTTISGRAGLDTITITLDTVAPGKPVVSGSSPVRTRTPTWTWVSGGGGSGTYRYRLDFEDMAGSALTTEISYTATKDQDPGTHTLLVQERDLAGNWSQSGKYSIRIDTTRPAPLSVSASPSSPTNESRPTWSWRGAGDEIGVSYRFQLDSPDFSVTTPETKAIAFRPEAKDALKEGLHTLFVQQRDSAGNWSLSASAQVLIDLTPPGAPKFSSSHTGLTNSTKPTWNWIPGNSESGGPGAGVYRVKLDDSLLATGATQITIPTYTSDKNLAEGYHRLYVQERDSAGNWSKYSSQFLQIDLTPPLSPVVSSATWHTTIVRPRWSWVSGGSGGAGTYRCKIDDSTLQVGSISVADTFFIPTDGLKTGIHTLYVQESDSAGNWSKQGSLAITIHGQIGYAAGDYGTVYKSINGGVSWDTLARVTQKRLYSIFFTDANNGVAVGRVSDFTPTSPATVVKTINGGGTFDAITNTIYNDLFNVFFASPNTGFAVGLNGVICRTSDAGNSWNTVNSGTNNSLNSIYFSSPKNGFAVGQYGTLLMTNDGGDKWKAYPTGIDTHLNSVFFLNASIGYAVGDAGVILRTIDGGNSWKPMTNGVTTNVLRTIFFTDPNRGFIGGDNVLMKTSDGGLHWKLSVTPALPNLKAIYFTEANIGYAVGEFGLIMKTVDYGEIWRLMQGRSEFDLYSISFP